MGFNLKKTLKNYFRVLKIAEKPNKSQFLESLKICFVGLIVVGLIGFIIYLISIITPIG